MTAFASPESARLVVSIITVGSADGARRIADERVGSFPPATARGCWSSYTRFIPHRRQRPFPLKPDTHTGPDPENHPVTI